MRLKFLPALLAAGGMLSAASTWFVNAQEEAAETAAPSIQVAENEEYGRHLVTADGHSIYLFTRDNRGESVCYGGCADNYIAVEATDDLTTGEGVDESLLGSIERFDGVTQLTYAGHPLYTHVRDVEPGMTRGQGRGDEIWLVNQGGARIMTPLATAPDDEEPLSEEEVDAQTEFLAQGESIFRNECAVCHGDAGEGGVGPRLANSASVRTPGLVVDMVIYGFPDHGMPAFGPQFDDEEIAAVATFVRNNFGNSAGPVSPEEVAAARPEAD